MTSNAPNDPASQSAISSALSDHKPQFQRLPKNIIPESYNITLKTDLEKCVFEGSVQVSVKVMEVSRTLKLDSDQLDVSNATLTIGSSGEVLKPEIKILSDEERLLFIFDKEIPVGDAVFSCEFRGVLGDKLRGLYRSKSKNAKGEDVYFAVTQFESMDAHRAFPCWDEPAIKATFNMTLIVKSDKLALSNMLPIDEQPLPDDWKVVRFQTTPKMSTYLVAVVVGNYEFVEGKTKNNVIVRVYVPIGKKEQGTYALDTAVKALDFFEEYYNVSYPLPKADFVSVADFEAGAMENWGLITCRETLILYDPKHSSTSRKQTIAVVISHELAHMWFGNLVTMEWWTDLWLNEGFARFMENLATDKLFPEYDIWTQFVSEGLNEALGLDALDSSHPIEVPIEHPAVVDEIFDLISYEKGASIIRMLNNYIGDKKFRAGMQLYLSQNKYKNTNTSDLWRALEEASSVPVESIMDTWVKQMGFPLVSVKSRKDGDNVILTLSQEKFYARAETPQRKKPQPIWKIPIDIATSKQNQNLTRVLIEEPTQEVVIKDAADADWIHINHGAVSVFRTLYEPDLLQTFLPAIKDLKLTARDRYMLHADISACVQSGYRNSTEVLQLTRAYENDTDFSVWNSITSLFEKLNVILSERLELQAKLHEFGRGLYRKIYEKLGWDPKQEDVHTTMLLRVQVLNILVTFGDEGVLQEARRRFAEHVSGKKTLIADIRQPVYRAMAKKMNNETWDQLMKLHKESGLQEEANRIAVSLGYVEDEFFIRKVIKFADTEVRTQDAPFVIASVASSALGRNIVWEHYTSNFEMYKKHYASGYLLTRLIKAVTEDFSSFEKAKEVENFFATKAIPSAELTVRQSIENIMSNAKWLQRDEQMIKEFFSKLN